MKTDKNKDLHYLITRVVNPYLNWILISLKSGKRPIHGRDGYTGLKWDSHTLGDVFAGELEDWREELWHKFYREFPENSKEIIESLVNIITKIDAKLPNDPNKEKILKGLWEMTYKIGEYLEISEYVKQQETISHERALEIRAKDEEIRNKLTSHSKALMRTPNYHTPNDKYNTQVTYETIKENKSKKKQSKLHVKGVLSILVVGLLLFSIYDSVYNDGGWIVNNVMNKFHELTSGSRENYYNASSSSTTSWSSKATQTITTPTDTTSSYSTSTSDTFTPPHRDNHTNIISGTPTCNDPQHSLEEALQCYLNKTELHSIKPLAMKLMGWSLKQSAWNVLEWEDHNMIYDETKANLSYFSIQSPSKTMELKKGVCVDYALFTVALLLSMGYSPVYVFDIQFSNSNTGHATAAIKINGKYFILDQHLPIMDLGTYWKSFAYWRFNASKGHYKNLLIQSATIYEIRLKGNGVSVSKVGTLTSNDFRREDYNCSIVDLENLRNSVESLLIENFSNLHVDGGIKSMQYSNYLPPGYVSGIVWEIFLPHLCEYYTPEFHTQLSTYVFMHIVDYKEIDNDLKAYHSLWLSMERKNGGVNITICLANP